MEFNMDIGWCWDHYATFCNRNYHPLFWIKWSHQILPVGKVFHCHHPKDSPNCPACDVYEDHDRILTYNHPSRHPLKQKLLSELQSWLDWDCYDPNLCDILVEGMSSLLDSTPFPFDRFSQRYSRMVQFVQRILLYPLALPTKWHLCWYVSTWYGE